MKDAAGRRDLDEAAVAVPARFAVAKLPDRFSALADVGDDVDLGRHRRRLARALGVVQQLARREFRLAEIAREGEQSVVGKRLPTEPEEQVVVPGVAQAIHRRGIERAGDVEAPYLGAERGVQGIDLEIHGVTSTLWSV